MQEFIEGKDYTSKYSGITYEFLSQSEDPNRGNFIAKKSTIVVKYRYESFFDKEQSETLN